MNLPSDFVLSLLFVLVIANMAIIAVLVASGRLRRPGQMTTTSDRAAVDRVLAASFSDPSARGSWDPAPKPVEAPRTAAAAGVIAAAAMADDETDQTDEPDLPAALAAAAVEPEIEASEEGEMATETEDDAEAPSEGEPAAADAPTSGGLSAVPDGAGSSAWRRDDLTGLIDADTFARLVADEDARVRRYERAATVVIFELDGLDRLMERLGDEAGERVVPAMADTIHRLARDADHVARLGVGRFGVLLPETDEVQAINYVERVRRACELWLESGAIALRLVTGWAGASREQSLPEAQRLATERMYTELRRNARRAEAAGESSMERAAS
jgi:diguanylate cyclase (GGDEF)-like protein